MPVNTDFLQEAAEVDSYRASTTTFEIIELAKTVQTTPCSPMPTHGSIHLHAHPHPSAHPGTASAILDLSRLMCTQLRCPTITPQVSPGSLALSLCSSLANVTSLLRQLWLTSLLWVCCLGTEMRTSQKAYRNAL